ncbi:cobaltochelatase subunit CobN [Xylanibacter caecicola]|uniref:cobaltochelatase subunit CobN n=1 Tax=Xylanibacter caecicola TaxID=2736294 RepID=UPI003B97AD4F
MNKKKAVAAVSALTVLLALAVAWSQWASTTRIAFVNYQIINLGQISKANTNSFIKISELDTDNLDEIGSYDMVFINGMGLRITAEQRELIKDAAGNGLPVLTTAATNPDNDITSVDSVQAEEMKEYLQNGGRKNYRSLLNYVRRFVDGKRLFADAPDAAIEKASGLLYHYNMENKDEEDVFFNSVSEYHAYLKKHRLIKAGAPQIIVTGQMGEPADLVKRLEETGNMVYCVSSMRKFINDGHADSIHTAAVINMAHGRMGDYMVDFLTANNIPLFSPLNVNRLTEEWEADKMGMSGGFMSQSIVTPEIDGAIRPFALFGNYKDGEGLQHTYAIPERLETFVQTVNNYVALKHKPNSRKRVAIYYYKGPGQNALTASGMEVVPSLFNLLKRMKREGYNVDGLPETAEELGKMLQKHGPVFNTYAEGASGRFIKNGKPELISKEQYDKWTKTALRPDMYNEVIKVNGEFPGKYMVSEDGRLAVSGLRLGNIVLLPQPAAGSGDNAFKIVHGTDAAPPHTYIASYLWARFGFNADAMIHFGTHGSLEYTPRKQVALSSNDWSDRLVGSLPHFYIYTINNVGEAMIAKRRSYAGIQSHITPPFMESNVRGIYRKLTESIKIYNNLLPSNGGKGDRQAIARAAVAVKKITLQLGIHRDLGLDSIAGKPYTEDEIQRIENFGEELASEKITGALYIIGVPYDAERIVSSVYSMATEPIAYGLLALDKMRGRANVQTEKHRMLFNRTYIEPAKAVVGRLLANPTLATDAFICKTAGITEAQLAKAREIDAERNAPKGMAAMMAMAEEMETGTVHKKMKGMKPTGGKGMKPTGGKGMSSDKALAMARMMGASKEQLKKMEAAMKRGKGNGMLKKNAGGMAAMMKPRKKYSKDEIDMATAIMEVERTLKNVGKYRKALVESPERELASMINALNGGYTPPSAGGDPIVNPNTLPTGRNLFAINAEETPTEAAWEKGRQLADNTIAMYRKNHNDSLPRKVSYTLWSSEFIETGGATIAQVLYMLGVEPVRDAFGRVTDLRLIPSQQLGRPRIDVVVQTSGQLRDIAASRLFLINRAVEMAAAAGNERYDNLVAQSVTEAEKILTAKGLTPKEAREMSTFRVFGGVNGNYGTGITGMVQAGDRWEKESEIADVYLNNMGAFYGSEKDWEATRQHVLEAALTNTDAVVQPRQSNTWGALSLDHVYEFMGGLNLAVRNVTGKDPDAYLSDYRNRNNARMQDVKEAIGVESRTTIFNPEYIKERMKGGASSAETFAEVVRNTYGWNVMKPKAVDKQMWDNIYNVYVKDKFDIGVRKYFESNNPAALEEITAVMLESARKGLWKASAGQVADIARLHTDLVNKYKPSCSGFVCDNAKLRQYIASKTSPAAAEQYNRNIREIREADMGDGKKGTVMKKEEMNDATEKKTGAVNGAAVAVATVVAIAGILILIVQRRRRNNGKQTWKR